MVGLRENIGIGARALGSLVSGRGRYLRALATMAEVLAVYGRQRARSQRALEDVHADAALRITRLCRRNGASWVKAAQFFSCRPDVLPPQYIDSLQTLQNAAQPVHFDLLKPVLAEALGADWTSRFSEFDLVPVATASIAQVHRARLITGEEVAVKIRLPEVARLFEQDSRIFRLLSRLLAPLVHELDVIQVTEQLLAMTAAELDLRNEAENLRRFARLPHPAGISVPVLHDDLSSESVMITGWVHGHRLREYLDGHPDEASRLLGTLFASYLQQVTRFGIYQADPHPGNFIVNDTGEITILDFGAIGRLTPEEVRHYSHLLYGLMGFAGEVDVGELFARAGFVGGNPETLRELSMYVLSDRLRDQHPLEAMQALLEKFREEKVRIPDSYIGISRVLITIGGFLMTYQVPFDWTPPELRARH
ncbi:protein kinase [Alcanivorax sp. S71-1-4]|uniref:ABC1 kinase family protein n=1 Tax=Alcanivorax sp. S71-1-4 TaxID=1177159 RepID=UPI00135BC15A|nr:AarF/UbiB family protein [Alcanivorax sp. S71-1-4]KAF0809517.1 protein kinase [Alcanivorax sp. S71-1-4]